MTANRVTRRELDSDSAAATEALGRWFGEHARLGLILDLRGSLGAGKTQFVRGLAAGLGVRTRVQSPTFTVCHAYEGRFPLYHLDAYRIEAPSELLLQGWDDMCGHGVVAVEWGDRVAELLPECRITVEFTHTGVHERRLAFAARGASETALVVALPAPARAGECDPKSLDPRRKRPR